MIRCKSVKIWSFITNGLDKLKYEEQLFISDSLISKHILDIIVVSVAKGSGMHANWNILYVPLYGRLSCCFELVFLYFPPLELQEQLLVSVFKHCPP